MGGNSKSLLAYEDVKEALDRAIASNKGIRLRFSSPQARDRFMFRSYSFRQLDRANNKVIYPEPAHSMHGRSLYETLSLVKGKENDILIVQIAINFEIEEL